MTKYYVEGCGHKKVLESETFKDAFADFMTWIIWNHDVNEIGFSVICVANERGFTDDLEAIGDKENLDNGQIALTYKALEWGGHYYTANFVKENMTNV